MQPPKNSLGIFTPTWFTCAAFLSKDDHRKFVAGTNSHQVIVNRKLVQFGSATGLMVTLLLFMFLSFNNTWSRL